LPRKDCLRSEEKLLRLKEYVGRNVLQTRLHFTGYVHWNYDVIVTALDSRLRL